MNEQEKKNYERNSIEYQKNPLFYELEFKDDDEG